LIGSGLAKDLSNNDTKKTKMKLLDNIEYLRFDILKDEIDWDIISDLDFTPKDLQKAIDLFLTSLMSNHRLPGNDYYKLQGIAHWIKENDDATPKQERYAIITMCYYWDQLDLFKISV
jgi:hypothetical protein